MRYILKELSAVLTRGLSSNVYFSNALFSSRVLAPQHKYYSTKNKEFIEWEGSRFADPTYDDTFKKLFGEESRKNILISALNSFLGFTGSKAIVSVDISNPMLEQRKMIWTHPFITGTIDVLCATAINKKIAVEMQGQKTPYFFTREHEYMAKLISGQVSEGEGRNYHNKVLDTYIIVLAKTNLFAGNTALKDQSLYEIDVMPTVRQTGEVYPGNKMHWKFFELQKFAQHEDSRNITKSSPLKFQWLDFFLSCAKQSDVPGDRDHVIKESYHIMDKISWEADERTLHWKHMVNMRENEEVWLEAIQKGEAKGKAEGEAKGRVEGKAEGIKIALKYNREANLEEDFNLSSKASAAIKKLPFSPETKDILDILIGNEAENYTSDHHDSQIFLSGVSEEHH